MSASESSQPLLPSWRDTATRRAILGFIDRVTDEDGPDYVAPEQRIATFDNDGTLWCEKPMYIQLAFILEKMVERVAANPELGKRQPWKAAVERHYAWFGAAVDKHYQGDESDVQALIAGIVQTFAGVTVEAFEAQASAFLRSASHPTLGMPYSACTYKPMVELLDCLAAHGFTTYIASAGGRDFVRPVSNELYNVPRERVIGSTASLQYVPDEAGGNVVHLADLDILADGPAKPVSIWSRVGRRPILAAGNANGDIQMLQYAEDPARPSLGLLLCHDDETREFAYTAAAEQAFAMAQGRGWTIISMHDDWSTVF